MSVPDVSYPCRDCGGTRSATEVLTQETTVDPDTAFELIGIGRTTGRQLLREGRFPVPVVKVGRRYRVPTAGLRELLGVAA